MKSKNLRASIIASVIVVSAIACSGADTHSGSSASIDSSGITIVQSTSPIWASGEEWQVAREPTVTIGTTDGADEYQLFRVVGSHRLEDGRIVVANWGSQELRFYDRDGGYLFAAGKEGGGPGEFRSVGRLWALGDTLFVMDYQQMRVSLFDTAGEFLHSFNLTLTEEGILPIPADLFSNGMLLIEHDLRERDRESGLYRDSVLLLTYSLNGDVSDTIGRFPDDETYFLIEQDRITSLPRPFGLESQSDVAGDRLYFGASDSYEIRVFRSNGSLERIIRRPVPNPVLEQALADEYHERLAERQSRMSPSFRQLSRQAELPDTKPAYSRILVDPGNNLWVAEYPSHDAEQSLWNVFDPEGRWLGTVETPYGGYIYQIGEDFLLGVWVDELGVEQVRLYRIERSVGSD
ncbi:MAG: hypothetical protein JSW51_00895 [Gemmatimonadota bacterium]|nr:MAG: hypothetical protein JSW51_00895 [Gemmatimonadota bacterium]